MIKWRWRRKARKPGPLVTAVLAHSRRQAEETADRLRAEGHDVVAEDGYLRIREK